MGNCLPKAEAPARAADDTEPDEYTDALVDACSMGDGMRVASVHSHLTTRARSNLVLDCGACV